MATALTRSTASRKKPRRAAAALRSSHGKQIAAQPGKVISAADLRRQLNLTQPVFARLIPVSVRSLATLESGTPPTDAVARRLVELRRLMKALAEVMHVRAIGGWLQTPNEAFDGLKPIEVIDRGEIDRLWGMIHLLRSGAPM